MSTQGRRNGALLVAISLISGFGSTAMSLVAAMWILDLTGSGSVAALAALCVYAPTLAAPWLGALVDRVPRRPLLIGVNLALAATLPSLLLVRSATHTGLIFAVLLVYGLGYVLLDAGEAALLPAVLPAGALGTVNGLRSSAQEGVKLLAPLVGAAIYAWRGGGAVALLSSLLPLVVAVLYRALHVTPHASGHATRSHAIRDHGHDASGRDTGGGVRATVALLWNTVEVRVPVLVAAVSIAASGFSTAAFYAAVTGLLRLPTTFLGVLTSAQGAGAIAGGAVVGPLLARRGATGVAVLGAGTFAAGCLLRCLPWWQTMVAGSVLVGLGLPWTLVAGVTAIQTHIPAGLLGRVSATANTVMFGPIAVAGPLGAVAVHAGSRPVLVATALACLLAAVLGRRTAARTTAHPEGTPTAATHPGTAPHAPAVDGDRVPPA